MGVMLVFGTLVVGWLAGAVWATDHARRRYNRLELSRVLWQRRPPGADLEGR